MRGAIIAILIIVILAALGWFFYVSNQTKTEEPAATTQAETQEATPSSEAKPQEESEETSQTSSNTITYNDSGFSPASLTVKSGETITWVNNSGSTVQVGSDDHPTHTINRELTNDQFIIELAPGESSSVQLSKKGEWGYHDHLKPGMTGTIIVE